MLLYRRIVRERFWLLFKVSCIFQLVLKVHFSLTPLLCILQKSNMQIIKDSVFTMYRLHYTRKQRGWAMELREQIQTNGFVGKSVSNSFYNTFFASQRVRRSCYPDSWCTWTSLDKCLDSRDRYATAILGLAATQRFKDYFMQCHRKDRSITSFLQVSYNQWNTREGLFKNLLTKISHSVYLFDV